MRRCAGDRGDSVGRLTTTAIVVLLGAAAGYTVQALTQTREQTVRVVDAESGADLSHLVLRADARLTPAGGSAMRPGHPVHYSFQVTNTGTTAVRHLVARSVKVAANDSGDRLSIRSISDPACSAVGRVECIFQRLDPGETRAVRVVLDTSPRERAGDPFVIHTFVGRFTGPVGGSVPLEVVGRIEATSGWFS